jgi:F-type H+-transporting ATPase subunit b
MAQLFSQLGIALPALLAQGFNFLVVLTVLTLFVYKPLGKIVDERRTRIEEGLEHAREADVRLADIGEKEKHVLAEAEKVAFSVIKDAEGKASVRAREIVEQGEKKGSSILSEAHALAARQTAEERASVHAEAAALIKLALVKTVELDPKQVDEKLIERAVALLRHHEVSA